MSNEQPFSAKFPTRIKTNATLQRSLIEYRTKVNKNTKSLCCRIVINKSWKELKQATARN